jgi:hypothetical protein
MVLNLNGGHLRGPHLELNVNFRKSPKLSICIVFFAASMAAGSANAQQLNLEGQTGGFITPTAYVVESAKGHVLSVPAIGYHFINAKSVIGDFQTFSFTEGFDNRAEAGYTRSYHTLGDATVPSAGAFSNLWNYNGLNIFHVKAVAFRDGQFGPLMPGVAVGGLVRWDDRFVSGAVVQEVAGLQGIVEAAEKFTNEDLYVAVTKTWAHPPVPFLVNFGWKATNGTIFGIGGQSTRFAGRLFGGIGIPLPGPFKTAIVPSAGFTQEPRTAQNLNLLLPGGVSLPTTLDYAVRVTQREHPHFALDLGIGQVAGNIGTAVLPTGLPAPYPPIVMLPVNLEARHVFGMGISIRP